MEGEVVLGLRKQRVQLRVDLADVLFCDDLQCDPRLRVDVDQERTELRPRQDGREDPDHSHGLLPRHGDLVIGPGSGDLRDDGHDGGRAEDAQHDVGDPGDGAAQGLAIHVWISQLFGMELDPTPKHRSRLRRHELLQLHLQHPVARPLLAARDDEDGHQRLFDLLLHGVPYDFRLA